MRKYGIANWQLVLLSLVIGALVGFIAAELYVRLAYPYRTADTLRRGSIEYEPALLARDAFPQLRKTVISRGARVSINSSGYRGPEFNPTKPNGVVRMVILGGSDVFDIFAADQEDWPHLVQQKLKDRGFDNIEIINAGIPGHASWDALGMLYGEIWMFAPDYVIESSCWNDIKYFLNISPRSSLLRIARPMPAVMVDGAERVANDYLYYANSVDKWLGHSQLYSKLRSRWISWRRGVQSG